MKYIKKFELNENLDFDKEMRKCVEYYQYIDYIGNKLANIVKNEIYPLLMDKKYDDALNMVKELYKPSRIDPNDHRTVIFIEADMLLSNIIRLKKESRLPEPKFKPRKIEVLNIIDEMKKCLKYEIYIHDIDTKSFEYIKNKIQPLIDIGEYHEAKDIVYSFYKPSRPIKNSKYSIEPIFIGYYDACRLINQAKRDREDYNL